MILAIFGYGRFGAGFAGLVRRAGHLVRVVDPAATVPVEIASSSAASALEGADLVVLAMPVFALETVLREIRPYLSSAHTVIDVGSVKEQPCQLLGSWLGTDIPHVGTHPLFGPLSIARGEPLRVVLCPHPKHLHAARLARKLFESIGCEVIEQDPSTHDRAMARTHALAFFIAKALVEMGVGEDLSMAPPSFLGLANMLAAVRGDAGHLFPAIQRENPYANLARAELIEHLDAIHKRLLTSSESLVIPPSAEPDQPDSRGSGCGSA